MQIKYVLAVSLLAGVAWSDSAIAQGGQVRVLCSNGIKAAVERVLPDAEKAIGRNISIEYSASSRFQNVIEDGTPFDVTILTPAIIDDLSRKGKLAAGSRADIASADLAVGVKAGSPKADISTPQGMKQRLLTAKTLTWTDGGAAGPAVIAMLKGLGIEQQVKSKIVLQTVPGRPAESIADGTNELMFAPVSEIGTVKGVDVLGYFPKEFQKPVVMTAAISSQAKDPAGAKAFIQYLRSAKAAPAIAGAGMKQLTVPR